MRKLKEIGYTILIVASMVASLFCIHQVATANADPGVGCETLHWGFLGMQRRIICDSQRFPDGSWQRARVIYTPAHYVPGYCGRYYCSSGYYVDETLNAKEVYTVFDYNVLPDEPGWLPPGTDTVR